MVLYDSSASISFSKIILVILMSLALTVLCVDLEYNEYSTTLHTCGRMFVNIVQAVPLPEVVQDTLAQMAVVFTNGMDWLNWNNQTMWS